jgi:glycine/D-amino acid oxidase-like deaminating enzyme
MKLATTQPAVGFGTVPYWHVTAPPRPTRMSEVPGMVDVAIIGAGFTGLWTALELRRREPTMSIAVFESQQVGYGASGRNAGYLTSWMHHSPQALLKLGRDTARAIHHAAVASVKDVLSTIRELELDCDLQDVPVLWTSSSSVGDRRIARDLAAIEELDSPTYRALSPEQLRRRVNTPVLSSGYEDSVAALVNPAKLVRSLADALVGGGLLLCEHTPVLEIDTIGNRLRLRTPTASVTASHAVLATNAWAASAEPFSRRVLPFYVYDIYTEPLSDADWERLGWAGREGVLDRRFFLINYRPTVDARVMFGGVDGRQPFGGHINPRMDRSVRVFAELRESFLRFFPYLSHVKMQFGHGGPIAMTPSLLPQVGTLDSGRILYSHGYCGHGVTQSNLCAGIVADLLLGKETERAAFPFVNTLPAKYPPEPLRSLGGLATLAEGRWFDRAGDEGRSTASEPTLLRTVTRLLNR